MKRFGVSLEEDLLEELDSLVLRNKLPNRSQAIRFLIRKNSVEDKWKDDEDVSGCIVLVYDHHKSDLLNKMIAVQHKYQPIVIAVQHAHLDHDNCLETIILKGKASQLKDLADNLIGIKGMKHGKLVMSAID